MPLTEKGQKIMTQMKSQYGEKEGERVFYASKNAGKISGVDSDERGDDNQHMGFTSEGAASIKKLVAECDALSSRLDAFEKRRSMQRPADVKPKKKDNMQPSMPHPKDP